MTSRASNISLYLSYSVAGITVLFGIFLVSGLMFDYVPPKLRITFGVVLMLWGIYRIVYTRMRKRQQEMENDDE